MDTGSEALLPECSHHSGGEQEGSAKRFGHDLRAGQDEAEAGHARGGPLHGRENQRVRLLGVLGQDQGGGQGGLRDRDPGGPAGQKEKEDQVCPFLDCFVCLLLPG